MAPREWVSKNNCPHYSETFGTGDKLGYISSASTLAPEAQSQTAPLPRHPILLPKIYQVIVPPLLLQFRKLSLRQLHHHTRLLPEIYQVIVPPLLLQFRRLSLRQVHHHHPWLLPQRLWFLPLCLTLLRVFIRIWWCHPKLRTLSKPSWTFSPNQDEKIYVYWTPIDRQTLWYILICFFFSSFLVFLCYFAGFDLTVKCREAFPTQLSDISSSYIPTGISYQDISTLQGLNVLQEFFF